MYVSDDKRGRTKVQHTPIRATEHIKWEGEESYIIENKGKIKVNGPVRETYIVSCVEQVVEASWKYLRPLDWPLSGPVQVRAILAGTWTWTSMFSSSIWRTTTWTWFRFSRFSSGSEPSSVTKNQIFEQKHVEYVYTFYSTSVSTLESTSGSISNQASLWACKRQSRYADLNLCKPPNLSACIARRLASSVQANMEKDCSARHVEPGIVMDQPLVLSHLILSTMPLLSYQMNYPTLQFGCYGTALYLIFYILSLFDLVDITIRFDSCLALLHTADSMPSHYFILLTLKPYPYPAKLYSYSAISLYVLSFTLLRHTKPITRLSWAYKNQTTEMWREKFILTRSPHTRL